MTVRKNFSSQFFHQIRQLMVRWFCNGWNAPVLWTTLFVFCWNENKYPPLSQTTVQVAIITHATVITKQEIWQIQWEDRAVSKWRRFHVLLDIEHWFSQQIGFHIRTEQLKPFYDLPGNYLVVSKIIIKTRQSRKVMASSSIQLWVQLWTNIWTFQTRKESRRLIPISLSQSLFEVLITHLPLI